MALNTSKRILKSILALIGSQCSLIKTGVICSRHSIVKVMSVRDSQCIRVVTPDDHVACGFHEILLHNMGEEELPFVATSELDYLRRIWPRALFAFMTRYQQDLERKRKECKERFGCTQSWNCTHCGKYIQMDLGKHIAFNHLELAQLWRCPVMWCTVWKGTGTVLTICGERTKCRCQSRRQICPSSFRRGQLLETSGWTCWCHLSPEWRLMRCCLVASVRLYVTVTGSSVGPEAKCYKVN